MKKKQKRHPMHDALETHLKFGPVGGAGAEATFYWLTSHMADALGRATALEKRTDQILEMISGLTEIADNILKRLDSKKCSCRPGLFQDASFQKWATK